MRDLRDIDLTRVCGGAPAGPEWKAYEARQRAKATKALRGVACPLAGAMGGKQAATEVYGADRTTQDDMIRAGGMLENICWRASTLPNGAKLPD